MDGLVDERILGIRKQEITPTCGLRYVMTGMARKIDIRCMAIGCRTFYRSLQKRLHSPRGRTRMSVYEEGGLKVQTGI